MVNSGTCSIIISYNPEIENLALLANALRMQCDFVVIIDNNSHNKNAILDITTSLDRCQCILLDQNTGIAHAQNIGIERALAENYSYIAFFDQDSTIDDDYINKQLQVFSALKGQHVKLAAIGPAFVDKKHGFHYKIVNIDRYGRRTKIDTQQLQQPFAASLIISSGSLVSAEALRAIGPMDERFFIDYVDTEWCLRAHDRGYVIYVNPQVQMLHAIGDNSLKLLRWRVPVHSPFRRYYRIRNAFFLLKMPHVPALLAMREIAFNLVHQLVLILCGQNKMAYVRSLWRGLRDGLNGKY